MVSKDFIQNNINIYTRMNIFCISSIFIEGHKALLEFNLVDVHTHVVMLLHSWFSVSIY